MIDQENATLRTRAEQAESALAEIADVLNQELRENGGDRFQVNGIGGDMRPAICALVDCVNRRAEAERDALLAEVGRLRETLNDILTSVEEDKHGYIPRPWLREQIKNALSSTPLSAATVERWKATERVVEMARKFVGVVEGPYLVENTWYKEMFDALAALDRTV